MKFLFLLQECRENTENNLAIIDLEIKIQI